MTDLIGKSLGRYAILEQLGEGGMATVYKAYDTRLETDVAVKAIRTDELSPKALDRALKRFEREAKSLARLTHPNIVKVTDYGEHEGMPFLVMTYLPGGTLKSKLGKPIPWQEAARTLLPIARALDFAHRQNMIHRDVKPSNILITADGEPMLTDFGIAKILDVEATADLTGTGMGIGTPEYMAPEQWTGQTTQQSDQYSLGVVFYEMLTGRKPYTADTPAAILLKQANEPLPRPSQFARGLPDKVEKLILKSLAKNPDHRYASMGAFATALESLLTRSPLPVLGEGPGVRAAPKREQTRTIAAPVVEEKTVRETPPVPVAHIPKQRSSVFRYLLVIGGVAFVAACLWFLGNLLWKEGILLSFISPPLPTYMPIVGTLPNEITDSRGVTMRLIPAGTFKMGSDDGNADEKPIHDVYLDSYYVDIYEVTNELYKACVDAGGCNLPTSTSDYNDSKYEEHPIVYVDWNMAKTYCEWRGASLPTEAQWEKAARGTDGRVYPWGRWIDPTRANYNSNVGDTAVGSYPLGVSPYGIYDMAGNVWEWVADWYSDTYYIISPSSNPLGPDTGTSHVLRGGASYYGGGYYVRSSSRWRSSDSAGFNIGFRCAVSADTFMPLTSSPPPSATEIPTQAPDPEEITDPKGVTMRLVPAGTFKMGSENGQTNERPVHDVYLDSYYMDVYEVTNRLYKACADAGVCFWPEQGSSSTRSEYFGNPEYDEYPVIYVNWDDAKTYCQWRGASLPTEAQWEKAARGTDGRTYPWGEGISCYKANYRGCVDNTTQVGSFPSGISPYGMFDLAGNVWEWVVDWYQDTFYQNSPFGNPYGPISGQEHILRGGSWNDQENLTRSTYRGKNFSSTTTYLVGFRCVRLAP